MKICIFGFGYIGRGFANLAEDSKEISIICFCDNNAELWGKKDENGCPVYSVSDAVMLLANNDIDGICIPGGYDDVERRLTMILQLRKMSVEPHQIFTEADDCSSSLVPVYSNEDKLVLGSGNSKAAVFIDSISGLTAAYIRQVVLDCACDVDACVYFTHNMAIVGDEMDGVEIISVYRAKSELREGMVLVFSLAAETLKLSDLIKDIFHDLPDREGVYFLAQEFHKKRHLTKVDIREMLTNDHRLIHFQRINVMLTDRCTQRCVNCSVCAGLVKEHWDYSFDKYRDDMKRLQEVIHCFPRAIVLFGGEPFLYEQLPELLRYTRSLLVLSEIRIITNAHLLQKSSIELIDAIKATNTVIEITFYPSMRDSIDDIISFCRQNGIRYELHDESAEFYALFSLRPDNIACNVWKRCKWRACTVIKDGYIGKCSAPFAIPVFNEHYSSQIPFEPIAETIDYRNSPVDRESLLSFLSGPSPACRYCAWEKPRLQKWRQIDGSTTLGDWLTEPISMIEERDKLIK